MICGKKYNSFFRSDNVRMKLTYSAMLVDMEIKIWGLILSCWVMAFFDEVVVF